MPIHKDLNHSFFKTWSPEMAYVLGYFAADGSMIRNKRKAHFIEFTSTDRILLEQLKRVTGSDHKITTHERGGNCKTTYRIQIGSKEWFESLSRLEFTQNKSKTLKFPEIPKKFFGHFVRGYFDGDGCAYFGKHWAKDRNRERWVFHSRFTSGSYEFLANLHTQLKIYGVKKGHISTNGTTAYDLILSHLDSLALYYLMYHTAEASNLFLPRKREKLEEAIQVLKLDTKLQS